MPVAARSPNFRLAIRVARMFDRRFVSLNKDVVEPLLQGTWTFGERQMQAERLAQVNCVGAGGSGC